MTTDLQSAILSGLVAYTARVNYRTAPGNYNPSPITSHVTHSDLMAIGTAVAFDYTLRHVFRHNRNNNTLSHITDGVEAAMIVNNLRENAQTRH